MPGRSRPAGRPDEALAATSRQPAQLLTVADLANVLQVTPAAVYALTSRGHIPQNAIFRIGRLLRFKRLEVEGWLDQGSHGATKTGAP